MYAYLFTTHDHASVCDDPRYKALAAACARWIRCDTNDGCLICPRLAGDTPPPQPNMFGKMTLCDDAKDGDLYFLPGREEWNLHSLARQSTPAAAEVTLANGLQISVALATAPAYRLAMSRTAGGLAGEHVTDFANKAWDLHEKIVIGQQTDLPDEIFIPVIFEAIQTCYHITEEAFSHLGAVTSDDIGPIMWAIWGADPKVYGDAVATSPPLPPASPPTPS